MFVEILDSIQAEIVESEQLQFPPRWVLRDSDLMVGPYHSAEEHEHHALQAIGSDNLRWSGGDELLFDRQTLILQSCWFSMLERELASDLPFAPWLVAKQKKGLLRLTAPQNFNLGQASS
jgi:hypothetical protein